MSQLVFEFWSGDLHPVIEGLERALGKQESAIHVMPSDRRDYVPMLGAISSIAEGLAKGAIISLSVRPKVGRIRYGLIDSASHYPDAWPISGWVGTIEYLDLDYKWLWDVLISIEGLKVVCLGLEEGPDLTDAMMSVNTFPWQDERLVLGAVNSETGWTVREGPSFFASQQSSESDRVAGGLHRPHPAR